MSLKLISYTYITRCDIEMFKKQKLAALLSLINVNCKNKFYAN